MSNYIRFFMFQQNITAVDCDKQVQIYIDLG